MDTKNTVLIAVVLLGAIIIFSFFNRTRIWENIAGGPANSRYDFNKANRSKSPNDALATSIKSHQTKKVIKLEAYTKPPTALLEEVISKLKEIETSAIRLDDESDKNYARFQISSYFFGYPDIVHIQTEVLPSEQTALSIYARARIGKSDFGVNFKRIKKLIRLVK